LLIHPAFIFLVIAVLECRPYYNNLSKKIYNELPQIGENFKSPNEDMIYYYNGKGKYTYSSVDCFFRLGNPSWSASIEEGGIRTIDAKIAAQIPLLGDMCEKDKRSSDEVSQLQKKNGGGNVKNYFSFNYLIDNFSDFAHVFSYVILALSICYQLIESKFKYWIAFWGCFVGGAVLEFAQYFFVVGRTASWSDQLGNSIGGLIGIAVFWALHKLKLIPQQ
ncbi:MAG: VanZ family protein, partial [Bacteroidota bacterium]